MSSSNPCSAEMTALAAAIATRAAAEGARNQLVTALEGAEALLVEAVQLEQVAYQTLGDCLAQNP